MIALSFDHIEMQQIGSSASTETTTITADIDTPVNMLSWYSYVDIDIHWLE